MYSHQFFNTNYPSSVVSIDAQLLQQKLCISKNDKSVFCGKEKGYRINQGLQNFQSLFFHTGILEKVVFAQMSFNLVADRIRIQRFCCSKRFTPLSISTVILEIQDNTEKEIVIAVYTLPRCRNESGSFRLLYPVTNPGIFCTVHSSSGN